MSHLRFHAGVRTRVLPGNRHLKLPFGLRARSRHVDSAHVPNDAARRWVVATLGILLLSFLVAVPNALAVTVTAQLDRTTAKTGDQVVLTVQAEGVSRNMSDPKLPPLDDFDVYKAGSSRNFSLINGRMSHTLVIRYALIPKKEGALTIGSIEVEIGDTLYRTDPLTLNVSKAPPPPAPPALSPDETGNTAGSESLFARATVDNPSPYQYEQVTYRVRLYTRVNVLDAPSYSPPTTQGFWREELTSADPYIETVDGKKYRVMEVALALFPTTPGRLSIGESVLDVTVQDPNRRRRDPFSVFGGSLLDGKRVVLRTESVDLDVKPLPPAPPEFQGAVGEFVLNVSTDRTEVSQSDPLTLTIELSGEGHLQTVPEIELPPLPQFRSYPAKSDQETSRKGMRLGGALTKEFVLVPLSAGELEIPSIEVVTFSPRAGRYKTLASKPITIEATAGTGVPGVGGSRGDIELLGRDILFIETEVPDFQEIGSTWGRARSWLVMFPFPILAYGVLLGWELRRRRLGDDAVLRRKLRAAKTARGLLKKARKSGAEDQMFRSAEALRTYLADRYDLPRAGLTPEQIEACLIQDETDPKDVLTFLDRADAGRYAPGEGNADADWVNEAWDFIDRLEKNR